MNLNISGDRRMSIILIILSAMAVGKTIISNVPIDHMRYVIKALNYIGVDITKISEDGLEVVGVGNCGFMNSGSIISFEDLYSLKIFMSLLSSYPFISFFSGSLHQGNLIGDIINFLSNSGVSLYFNEERKLPIAISGESDVIPNDVTVKSGILKICAIFRAMNSHGITKITDLSSFPDYSFEDSMFFFGKKVEVKDGASGDLLKIRGMEELQGQDLIKVPSDVSDFIYNLSRSLFRGNCVINVSNILFTREVNLFVNILKKMGCKVEIISLLDLGVSKIANIKFNNEYKMYGIEINSDDFYSLGFDSYILFVLAVYSIGYTRFINLDKNFLEVKKMLRVLESLGVKVEFHKDEFFIFGAGNDSTSERLEYILNFLRSMSRKLVF